MVENGLTGDFAVCGEPTNLAVSVMSKGVFRVKARLHGRAAHSKMCIRDRLQGVVLSGTGYTDYNMMYWAE